MRARENLAEPFEHVAHLLHDPARVVEAYVDDYLKVLRGSSFFRPECREIAAKENRRVPKSAFPHPTLCLPPILFAHRYRDKLR